MSGAAFRGSLRRSGGWPAFSHCPPFRPAARASSRFPFFSRCVRTQALLLLAVGLGPVAAQSGPGLGGPDDPEHGDDPNLEDMILARSAAARVNELYIEDFLDMYDVFTINGTRISTPARPLYNPAYSNPYDLTKLPRNDVVPFRELNIMNALVTGWGGMRPVHNTGETAYDQIPLVNRSANNLGGMGPNNHTYCYNRGTVSIPYYSGACDRGQLRRAPQLCAHERRRLDSQVGRLGAAHRHAR